MKQTIKMELINKQLKGYQEAVNLIPSIKETAKQFDDKKITKRFDTAIKKIDENLSFNLEYNSFRVKYYNRDRFVTGEQYTEYIQEDVVDLVFGCIESGYGDGICQNGVFSYVNFEKAIDGRGETLIRYIVDTKNQLSMIEELQEEKKQIEELKDKHNDKVNFIMEHYFSLKVK